MNYKPSMYSDHPATYSPTSFSRHTPTPASPTSTIADVARWAPPNPINRKERRIQTAMHRKNVTKRVDDGKFKLG